MKNATRVSVQTLLMREGPEDPEDYGGMRRCGCGRSQPADWMVCPCAPLCRQSTLDSEDGTRGDLLDPADFAVLCSTQGRVRRQADAQALRQEAVRRFGMQP